MRLTSQRKSSSDSGQQNIHVPDDFEQIRFIARSISHPQYSYKEKEFDIGLVKVSKPLDFTERVHPVLGLDEDGVAAGTVCTATGWGITSESGLFLSSELREVCTYQKQNETNVKERRIENSVSLAEGRGALVCRMVTIFSQTECQQDCGVCVVINGAKIDSRHRVSLTPL